MIKQSLIKSVCLFLVLCSALLCYIFKNETVLAESVASQTPKSAFKNETFTYSNNDVLSDVNVDDIVDESDFYSEEEECPSDLFGSPELPASVSLDRPVCKTDSFELPLNEGKVSSLYGFRVNPVTGIYKFHKGYDIAAPNGQNIFSMNGGTVTKVSYDENGYGHFLVVSSSDEISTLYAHCSEILVSEGHSVKKGEAIAKVGSSGAATGAHLHVELIYNGVRYDPEWILGGIYD